MPNMNIEDRRSQFRKVAKQITDVVVFVMHPDVDGVRAVIYEVVKNENQRNKMTVVDYSSSGYRKPPHEFTVDDARGQRAFDCLNAGEAIYVPDLKNAPENWEGSGDGYDTSYPCQLSLGLMAMGC